MRGGKRGLSGYWHPVSGRRFLEAKCAKPGTYAGWRMKCSGVNMFTRVHKGPQGSTRVHKGPQGSTRVHKGQRGQQYGATIWGNNLGKQGGKRNEHTTLCRNSGLDRK